MRRLVLRFGDVLDRVTRWLCMAALVLLVTVVLVVVVLRYGFGTGFIALQDLANYAFAIFLALAVPVTLVRDGHVRVEIISEKLPPSYLKRADLVALVFFLIPVFGLAVWTHWPELVYSWTIREASVETGGLPGLFVVKTALTLSAALMILQGVVAAVRARTPGEETE